MNSTLSIRRATSNDAELIAELGRSTFYNTFNGTCTKADMQYVLNLFFNHHQVMSELNDKDDFFYIAFQHKKAIGYCRLKADKHLPFDDVKKYKSVELKRFYFSQEAHGSGAAKILMDYILDIAKKMEFEKIYLGVWEYNIRAQEFYKKMGFKNTHIANDFPLGATPQTDYWFWKTV